MCKQSPDRYVSAQTLVIQAYCDVEHYHLARLVATHSDEWIQKQKPIKSAATMMSYKIAKAHICLGENKVSFIQGRKGNAKFISLIQLLVLVGNDGSN